MKLAPKIMNEVSDIIECSYPLRIELRFKSRNIRTVRYEIETAAFVGSRRWSCMPNAPKESTLKIKNKNLEARKLLLQIL